MIQLQEPFGLDVDDDQSLVIADTKNHRIVRWMSNEMEGEVIVGGNEAGNGTDQLNQPATVLIDRMHGGLIISEWGNRRVIRWPLNQERQNGGEGEVIILDTLSLGLALDDKGSLYVSDHEEHQVRRYKHKDRREGVIVAGGCGKGAALNQLDGPRQIFVDADRSVYVSDSGNHRVMKWTRGAREGVVVAGGHGQGDSLAQLYWCSGIFVDQMGSVYIVDQGNHRVMRWTKDAKEGEVVAGGNGRGSQNNQFDQPSSVSLDDQGNLYVVDLENHRVQRFDLDRTLRIKPNKKSV